MAKLSVEIWTLSQEENEYLYFLSSELILSSASHYDLCSFFPRLKLCPAEGNNWPIWPAAAAAGTTLHTGENKDTLVLPISPHCPVPTCPHYPDQQSTLVKVQNIQLRQIVQIV